MKEARDRLDLPVDLPVPVADGACTHLPGTRLPILALPAIDGEMVDLSALPGRSVVYAQPRAGRSGHPLPRCWDENHGARDYTPPNCAYRDLS